MFGRVVEYQKDVLGDMWIPYIYYSTLASTLVIRVAG